MCRLTHTPRYHTFSGPCIDARSDAPRCPRRDLKSIQPGSIPHHYHFTLCNLFSICTLQYLLESCRGAKRRSQELQFSQRFVDMCTLYLGAGGCCLLLGAGGWGVGSVPCNPLCPVCACNACHAGMPLPRAACWATLDPMWGRTAGCWVLGAAGCCLVGEEGAGIECADAGPCEAMP